MKLWESITTHRNQKPLTVCSRAGDRSLSKTTADEWENTVGLGAAMAQAQVGAMAAGGVGVNRRGYEDQLVWCVLGTIPAEQASKLQTQRLQCPAIMRTHDDMRCAVVLRGIILCARVSWSASADVAEGAVSTNALVVIWCLVMLISVCDWSWMCWVACVSSIVDTGRMCSRALVGACCAERAELALAHAQARGSSACSTYGSVCCTPWRIPLTGGIGKIQAHSLLSAP